MLCTRKPRRTGQQQEAAIHFVSLHLLFVLRSGIMSALHCSAPVLSISLSCPQLWSAYLAERRQEVRGLAPTHGALEALNNTYERALVSMHKMPRIWLEYLALLVDQRLVTRTRRGFDRAICALPITQHDRIWQLYLVRYTCLSTPMSVDLHIRGV